jgi:hypothetical protein
MAKIYGDFGNFGRFWAVKNKPNMPAFGRKSDNSGGVAGRLLPRVGRETSPPFSVVSVVSVANLKKQTQFYRSVFGVQRTALR